MQPSRYENLIEALIFASEKGISISDIRILMSQMTEIEIDEEEIKTSIIQIESKYCGRNFSFELVQLNGGYQFLSKKEYYPIIKLLNIYRSKKALSQAALETLSIIAYKQPVTKLDIEQIRGVNCDYSIQKLLDKELIVISGRSNTVGKPLLYSVSDMFMDYFGINSSADLPKLKELVPENNEIGSQAE
jgi:segregation and condensation protein B